MGQRRLSGGRLNAGGSTDGGSWHWGLRALVFHGKERFNQLRDAVERPHRGGHGQHAAVIDTEGCLSSIFAPRLPGYGKGQSTREHSYRCDLKPPAQAGDYAACRMAVELAERPFYMAAKTRRILSMLSRAKRSTPGS